MNMNMLAQIMKSTNPQQMILNQMNPQQRQIAEQFLKSPNRDEALNNLIKQYGIDTNLIEQFKNNFGINR